MDKKKIGLGKRRVKEILEDIRKDIREPIEIRIGEEGYFTTIKAKILKIAHFSDGQMIIVADEYVIEKKRRMIE